MGKETLATFLVFGGIILVALVCFTILDALGTSGTGVMRDVLLGLVSGFVGAYAVVQHSKALNGEKSKDE